MKSEKRSDNMPEKTFWDWFIANARLIASNTEDGQLIGQLDQLVTVTWPNLAWEIGPDLSGGLYFALSPNLDRNRAEEASRAIKRAPSIAGWRFYATRQRKEWDGRFEIQSKAGIIELNANRWQYVLLRYPNGSHEVVLISPEARALEKCERWQAAAIVLEGLLGEECVLDKIETFDLQAESDTSFSGKEKPIDLLPQAFGIP